MSVEREYCYKNACCFHVKFLSFLKSLKPFLCDTEKASHPAISHMGTSSWNFRPPAAPPPPTPHTPLAQEKPLTLPFHLPRSSPYLSSSVCPGGKHWPFVCMSGGWGVGCVALLFLCPLQYLSVWEAGEWQVWAWPHVSLTSPARSDVQSIQFARTSILLPFNLV